MAEVNREQQDPYSCLQKEMAEVKRIRDLGLDGFLVPDMEFLIRARTARERDLGLEEDKRKLGPNEVQRIIEILGLA